MKSRAAMGRALLIAAPEYNSSLTPLLKNSIDWVSRATGDEPPLVAFQGKAAALMSASPGGLGGLRGLVHVRSILASIGVLVLPDQDFHQLVAIKRNAVKLICHRRNTLSTVEVLGRVGISQKIQVDIGVTQ